MKVALCLLLTIALAIVSVHAADSCPAFTYEEAGSTPDLWGSLCPQYATCSSGRQQSPINIVTSSVKDADFELSVEYGGRENATLVRNEHTIVVTTTDEPLVVEEDNDVNDEDDYGLLQFHFHHPSEHRVDGKSYDLEIHYVHRDSRGNLAVVGYLVEASTTSCAFLADLQGQLPDVIDETTNVTTLRVLTPFGDEFWHYKGSLTTPPCTEGVSWFVQREPLRCTSAQIASVVNILGVTNRPVQGLFGREVLYNQDTIEPFNSPSSDNSPSSNNSPNDSPNSNSNNSNSNGNSNSNDNDDSSSSSATQLFAGVFSLLCLLVLV